MAGGGQFGNPTTASAYPKHYIGSHQALMTGTGSDMDEFEGYSLPKGVLDVLGDALNGANPFTALSAYDSETNMTTAATRQGTFETLVDGLDAVTDWGTFKTTAVTAADAILLPESDITTSVSAFKSEILPEFAVAINGTLASLYNSNAAETSALPQALIVLRGRMASRVAAFRDALKRDTATAKANFVVQAIGQMVGLQGVQVDGTRVTAAQRLEVETTRANAAREAISDEIELRYKETIYYLGLFPQAGNVLANFSGGVQMPLGPSKLSTAISTGAALAAQGVALGAKAGPGAAIGLGLGLGTLGALSSLAGARG